MVYDGGIWASFGLTVMARISLLIGRIQFLVNDVFLALKQAFSAKCYQSLSYS